MNVEQSTELKQQSSEIKQLLKFGKDTSKKLDIANENINIVIDEIATLKSFTRTIAHVTLAMWIGATVMKTQLANLRARYNPNVARQHLKASFVVAFRSTIDNTMKVFFCNTNFKDIRDRIKSLYNRMTDYNMIGVRMISLASCEINVELAMLRGLEFEGIHVDYEDRLKAFNIELANPNSHEAVLDAIVNHITKQRLQLYQSRMDELSESHDFGIDDKVLNKITTADSAFFDITRPFWSNVLRLLCLARYRYSRYGCIQVW